MPSKREKIPVGEYCHIYNRGTDKRLIFNSEDDLERFIESMYLFNTLQPVISLNDKKKSLGFSTSRTGVGPLAEPLVEIVAYSLLPNHFHILLMQMVDGGISEFMKRLQCGYTSYFNVENDRSGVLFQGKYKYKHVANDNYFRNIFCYVTFNSMVHSIPKNLIHLSRSSFDEYSSKSTNLISNSQKKFVLDIFNGSVNKIKRFGSEVTSIIREKRLKKDYKADKTLFE